MNRLKTGLILTTIAAMLIGFSSCNREQKMQQFIDAYVEQMKPLQKAANLAYWEAATTGSDEKYALSSEMELQLKKIHSNPRRFAELKNLIEKADGADPARLRQLQIIYNQFLPNQVDSTLLRQIVEKASEVEKKFSNFRCEIDGKRLSSNDIDLLLKIEKDSQKREKAWEASKQVGEVVAGDMLALVKLRNEAARKLGFDNFHTLSLTAGEQDVHQLDQVFAELKELTDEPFRRMKADLDSVLARRSGIAVAELMPWHYHDLFFQEAPQVYALDLDHYYAGRDVVELARLFYAGIGLPVESILQNSDLFEREGKNPHAFSTDIDREGDVRILCNVTDNERWMETMLHELGHAVYDKYHDEKSAYLFRTPAHAFTTEGIAMFFGRLSRNPWWMQSMLGLSDASRDEILQFADQYMRMKQLVFARWAMVMYEFEKQLYADPEQDLNALWWNLVHEYQLVNKPPQRDKPDWASKIHIALYPAYYHNYLLGELFASQLQHYLDNSLLGLDSDRGVSYIRQKEVGNFLREKIFAPGARYEWNDMITQATGEPLTARYFVEQFVKAGN
jgi:peptidyl-dipeptidase A